MESWNEQFREWLKKNGKTQLDIAHETGIPQSTINSYATGNTKDVNNIIRERRKALYELTNLECFNPDIEYKEAVQTTRESSSNIEKLGRGELKFQQYRPTLDQRCDAIMELIDVLAEEIDYFRTASSYEKEEIGRRIKNNPESFSYFSQMINIFYKSNEGSINSWMLVAQPPSKLRRIQKK